MTVAILLSSGLLKSDRQVRNNKYCSCYMFVCLNQRVNNITL